MNRRWYLALPRLYLIVIPRDAPRGEDPSMLAPSPAPATHGVAVAQAYAADRPFRPVSGTYDTIQRGLDLAIASVLLIVAAPLLAAAWAVVRLTSPGGGFYCQLRVGRHGESFVILKLRTMYHECEARSGVRWATENDSRVTPVGRILRKLHIDELPQLLNILSGDMSLVGPRPERPEFVGPLSNAVPGYTDRLLVRPGLTGLAQVQLPPDSDLESVRRKLVLDRYYISRRGLGLDLRLLLGTAVYLAGAPYAFVRWCTRLPNPLADVRAAVADPLADTVIDTAGPK
jgi:lipopolysaccharide/colanic/teichoic acid biosynthesis glycosyltransferase